MLHQNAHGNHVSGESETPLSFKIGFNLQTGDDPVSSALYVSEEDIVLVNRISREQS